MASKETFRYDIVESLGTIQETAGTDFCIEVNKISWNGKPPQMDIRRWKRGTSEQMLKGISLSDEAVDSLVNILLESGFGSEKIMKKILKEKGYKVIKKTE